MITLLSLALFFTQASHAQQPSPTLRLLQAEERRSAVALGAGTLESAKNIASVTTAGESLKRADGSDAVSGRHKDPERPPLGNEMGKNVSQPIDGIEVVTYQEGPDTVKAEKPTNWKAYGLIAGGLGLAVVGAFATPLGAAILGFIGGALAAIGVFMLLFS